MEKALKNVIKNYQKLSDEDLNEFMDFLKKDEPKEEPKVEEVKKEVVKKEVKEEPKKEFVTNDQLKSILEEVLGKVALKEEVDLLKVDKKKAKEFGIDGKPIVNEVDDRDSRLSKILSDLNS